MVVALVTTDLDIITTAAATTDPVHMDSTGAADLGMAMGMHKVQLVASMAADGGEPSS